MNTIKQQATVNVTAKNAKSYEIGFEAGADYVIEKICNVFNNNSSCEKVILEIGKLISQLTK